MIGDGGDIVATAQGGNNDYGRGIAVQTDGKILVAGYTQNGSVYEFALIRFDTDGNLDTSFGGGDGIATFDMVAAVASDDPQTAEKPPQASTEAMASPPRIRPSARSAAA